MQSLPSLDSDPDAPTRVRVRRRSRRWRRKERRRKIYLGLAVVGGVALLGALQLALSAWQLQSSAARVAEAQVLLWMGEADRAEESIASAHSAAGRADLLSRGPHLWLAEKVPLVGGDVRALRTVADAAEELTGAVAEDLFAIRTTLDPEQIRPVRGQMDLRAFEQGALRMGEVAAQVATVQARLEGLAAPRLPLLRRPVAGAVDAVRSVDEVASFASEVLDMTPRLLGADERRRYLIVFQNNAEFRSTGGIPGAFAVLSAKDGQLRMGEQGTSPELNRQWSTPVVEHTDEEQILFDGKLARYVQNVNMTPDWTRSGEILAAMWERAVGERIDGVLSVDPVVLAQVLRGTGPVDLPDGKVATAETAVQVLLNQTYLDYPVYSDQDAFFEESARRIFDELVRGRGDAGVALQGLYDGVREGRGFLWLRDPDEQQVIADNAVAGGLSDGSGRRPEVGVFLNDSTGTKLDYYVNAVTTVTRESCLDGGRQRLRMQTTLTSAVPENAAQLPELLLGDLSRAGGPPGSVQITVHAYSPPGGTVTDPTVDGEAAPAADFGYQGRTVSARTIALRPGETRILSWSVLTGPDQPGEPLVRATPTAWSSGVGTVERSGC